MSAKFPHFQPIGIVPILLIALVFGCSRAPGVSAEKGDAQEAPAVEVRTVPAEQRTVDETVHAIGRSEALPNRLVTLTPAVAGHVHEIPVTVGDAIHRGDTIVRLDSIAATADMTEKEAQRAVLKAALDLLVAPPRPEDRRAPEIACQQAKIAVARAEALLERLTGLRARKEISEAQWFDAEQTLAEAKLHQQSAEAQLQLLLVGPRPEAVAEAKARLAAVEQTLAAAREHLAQHELRSPIAGVVDSLNCHPGQAIAAATVVAEVIDSSELYVTVWLPARSAEKIKVGHVGTIAGDGESNPGQGAHEDEKKAEDKPHDAETSDAETKKAPSERAEKSADAKDKEAADEKAAASDDTKPNPMIGKVVSIGRIVDPQTGNLPVRLLFANADNRLAVGQTVSLSIVVAQFEKALVVPAAALIDLGEGPLLIVVREGKVVHLHPESVVTHGGWTIVGGTDLEPGESVVVDGGFNLPENTPVKENAGHSAAAEAE